MTEFLRENWTVVAEHALLFLVFAGIVISITAAVTRAVLGGALTTSKERLALAREDIDRLRGEKDDLLRRIEQIDDSIVDVRRELQALPRNVISEGPPLSSVLHRTGDVWMQVAPEDDTPKYPLGPDELGLLRIIAFASHEHRTARDLAASVNRPQQQVAEQLNNIVNHGLLQSYQASGEERRYVLNDAGRDYLSSSGT
jgi:hypothetical protein